MALEAQFPKHVSDVMDDASASIQYHRFVGSLSLELPAALEALRTNYVAVPSGEQKAADEAKNLSLLMELERQVLASRADIPTESWGAIKSGRWTPGRPGTFENFLTVSVSIFAILLVVITGKLTVFHNNVLAIQAELQELEKADVGKSYGRMLRLMHQAWGEADRALCVAAGNDNCITATEVVSGPQTGENQLVIPRQFDIARNTYFDTESDLSSLAKRVSFATTSSDDIVRAIEDGFGNCEILAFALPLPSSIICPPKDMSKDSNGVGKEGGKEVETDVEVEKPPIKDQISACLKREFGDQLHQMTSEVSEIPARMSAYETQLFDLGRLLNCRFVLPFVRENIPSIASSISAMRGIFLPISLILLPALYGATGAVLAVLRRRLDLTVPNLGFSATLFRVCRGSVIGVVVVWFATPDSVISNELTSLGLSLFAFVLVLGFAQDRLFEMLDVFADRFSTNIRSDVRRSESKT